MLLLFGFRLGDQIQLVCGVILLGLSDLLRMLSRFQKWLLFAHVLTFGKNVGAGAGATNCEYVTARPHRSRGPCKARLL